MNKIGKTAGTTFAILTILAASAQAAVEMSIKANREEIFITESVLLEIKVNGMRHPPKPDLSKIKECKIEYLGGQNRNEQYAERINGKLQYRRFYGAVFTFKLTPEKTGIFKAGPINLNLRTQTISKNGPTIGVTGLEKQDSAILTISSSKESIIVGEPFEITLAINLKCLKGNYADVDPIPPSEPHSLDIPYLNGTPISGLIGEDHAEILKKLAVSTRNNKPGFTVNEYTYQPDVFSGIFNIGNNQEKRLVKFDFPKKQVTLNGEKYLRYTLKTKYTPKQEGTYTFGPVEFKGKCITSVNRSRQPTTKNVMTIGSACSVLIIPPPENGRPPSYAGAIGSNMSVSSEIDTQTCKIGDPLTLTITISGDISMDNMYPPQLGTIAKLAQNFKIYDDAVQITSRPDSTTYAYTIRPTTAGTIEIPPIPLSFFDTTKRAYKTVTTIPIPVRANAATDAGDLQIFGTSSNNTANILSFSMQDLSVPAPFMASNAHPISVNLRLANWQIIMILLVPAACLIMVMLIHAQAKWRNRSGLRHKRGALRTASLLLNTIRKSTASPKPELSKHICSAMQEYAGRRAGVTEQSITPQDASNILKKYVLKTELVNQYNKILERNFNATYSSKISQHHDPAKDAKEALTVLNKIDVNWKKITLALILLFSIIPVCANASISAEQMFIWKQANATVESARTSEDFATAAKQYNQLLNAGVKNGLLFYNLGSALLHAGDYDNATKAFIRAERYMGSNWDIKRNLRIALAHNIAVETTPLPWYRLLLFWHYNLSGSTRITIATCTFSLISILIALRVLGIKRFINPCLAITGIILVIFGSSALTTIHQESIAETIKLDTTKE